MNERVHRFLDGELRREDLTADQLAELASYEAAIQRVLAPRADRVPDLAPSVMGKLAHLYPADVSSPATLPGDPHRPSRRSRPARLLVDWWTPRPVTVRVRPALAAAALALLAALPLLVARSDHRSTAAGSRVLVQFRLDLPDAQRVELAGDFTRWKPAFTLHQATPGVWSVIVALDEGVHDYLFLVNGERWVRDPLAPAVDDGFGGNNSRVAVIAAEQPRSL